MNDDRTIVTGAFEHLDSLVAAVKELRAGGHDNLTVYSPVHHHEIDEVMEGAESKVGSFALTGGILGWIAGLALTVGTAIYLPIIVGGKPIISFIPFYVIGFELTILLGGLFTFLGFVILSRISRERRREKFNSRFVEDLFGLAARCPKEAREGVERALRDNGALEVSFE